MLRNRLPTLVVFILTVASSAFAQQREDPRTVREEVARQPSAYWLDVQLKARSMLVDPAEGQLHEVKDDLVPIGIASPDGKFIAAIGSDPQRVKEGHDFDLFLSAVDPVQPSRKSIPKRLTTDQIRPTSPTWLPTSSGIAFLAGEESAVHAWYIDLAPDSKPVRLNSNDHRCSRLSVLADGRIAWLEHKDSKGKQQFIDLVVHPSPLNRGKLVTVLADQHISSYAFSPDGHSLAWSGLGSMFIVNLETNSSREIPLHGIHRQLMNHTAHQIAWRPDGNVIAIHCGFLGGISRAFNADPNEPWPRMFAEDKVFFVPVDWKPSPESLNVSNQNFPSPTADDPKAEVSPPADDESKPWWIRELPMTPIELKWITADEARNRLAPQQ